MSAQAPLIPISGVSPLFGFVVGIFALVVMLAVVGVFVIIEVANRAKSDASGPIVVYLFGVSFVTLWTALIGSVAVVSSLVQLIGSHPGFVSGDAIHPVGDAVARGLVLGGLTFLISIVTFVAHLRKGIELGDLGGDPTSPARRIAQSYVSAVAFVSVLILIISLVSVIYLVFVIGGPGVFGGGERTPTLRRLLDTLYVVVASGVVLSAHLKLARPQLWRRSSEPNSVTL